MITDEKTDQGFFRFPPYRGHHGRRRGIGTYRGHHIQKLIGAKVISGKLIGSKLIGAKLIGPKLISFALDTTDECP